MIFHTIFILISLISIVPTSLFPTKSTSTTPLFWQRLSNQNISIIPHFSKPPPLPMFPMIGKAFSNHNILSKKTYVTSRFQTYLCANPLHNTSILLRILLSKSRIYSSPTLIDGMFLYSTTFLLHQRLKLFNYVKNHLEMYPYSFHISLFFQPWE
jgi:hypothetical protein